jgi:phosphoesterase RecJ-like protein
MIDPTLKKIAWHLTNGENIVILPHINADGDALGAALALGIALKSLNKEVDVLIEEEIPSNLDFLPGQELIKSNPQKTYNISVNIDNGDITRLGEREHYFWSSKVKLSIDHHATNKVMADYSYVDTRSAATGEIIYDLILNYLKTDIDKDIALCLYTAIVTDTGGFRYTNTTSRTLRICAELLNFDIDFPYVIKKVFDMVSYTKMNLMKQTMNSLLLYGDGKLAVSFLTLKDIKNLNVENDDYEGLVNIGRNLEGVEVSLFLREEQDNHFRGNLRSNDYVDVSKIAEKFGGGGHKRAAGFNINGKLDDSIDMLVSAILPEIRGVD